MAQPTIYYFPIRGRAEPSKLLLASQGTSFKLEPLTSMEQIKDLSKFKFGQAPAYSDDEVSMLSQSNAILRHLGRKYNLYGQSRREQAAIDEVVDAVEDLTLKYLGLIYKDQLADEARATYWTTHGDPATTKDRNGGAHLAYLAGILTANSGNHVVGGSLSIADIAVWNAVDNHMTIFQQEITRAYPELAKFHQQIASNPKIKSYLESDLRLQKNNNNGLG